MPEPDAAELLKDLKTVSANLKRHVQEEGRKFGAELGKTYAKAADDRIRENAADMQRLQDLVAKLRQQMKPLVQIADEEYPKLRAERDDLRRRLQTVRTCKVWIDDLGRKFVFCDELWHATDPEHNPAPEPVRLAVEADDAPRS
jgi:flagellar motility protein MotE (MotC chaperone)